MAFFAVFLPAAAFVDFFSAFGAVFFAAAIFTTPFKLGALNCCLPSGTQKEGRLFRNHSVDPLNLTDALTSARNLNSVEHLGSSVCTGLVRGLENVVNPIFLLCKPLTN